MAEFPHLETIASTRVMTDNHPAAAKLMRENKPCMMIAGHCGNWEIAGPSFLLAFKFPMDITYRAPNNPWSEKLLMKARSLGGRVQGYSKSRSGGMGLVRAMKEGRCIGMLIDQKYNEGIAVPFFGHPAMTTPAFVEMSRKYGYTLIPTRLERLSGAHFKITTYEPLVLGGRTTKDVIGQAHGYLEDWIRDKPAQWLWLHRRWGKVEPEEMKDTA
ncbi:MAG: lysophospholipid acyltransferase family protein [Rhodospirillales bacterium]|nr:lysophospholipid acyltransferase family protein [Rhodospirillales bacterium]